MREIMNGRDATAESFPAARDVRTALVIALAFSVCPWSVYGETSADAGSTAARSSNSGTSAHRSKSAKASDRRGTGIPEHDRSPADVREDPIPFEGDLTPLGDGEAEKLLGDLCGDQPARLKVDGEPTWACRVCPGFTTRAGENGPLVLDRAIRGDFLEDGEEVIFVTYRGCEASNTAHGGAVIFRKRKGAWEPHYRHPGLNPQACLVFRSEEHRDRLICRLRYESKGKVIQEIIDAADGDGTETLVRTIDNTGRCPKRKYVSSYLAGWKRGDLNGDGRPDLRVEIVQRHKPLGKNNEKPICRLEQVGGSWKRVRRIHLDYHYDGRRLVKKGAHSEDIRGPLPDPAVEAVRQSLKVKRRALDRATERIRALRNNSTNRSRSRDVGQAQSPTDAGP